MPIGGAAIIARFIRSIRRITISAVFVLSASAASQIHPALAQTVPIQELEPVIVTATRLPAKEKELTSSVTVITREEIEQQHANRVSEILETVPGLYVDEMGARGGLSSVYIRGGDPNFTTVMIDGVQINDPTNPRGGSVDLSRLTPEQIERIEILRGPASSLYGSDPMAGVVNIITKRGKQDAYSFTLEGGSFNYVRSVLQASGAVKPVNYASSFGFSRNDAEVKKDSFRLGNAALNLDFLDWSNSSLRVTTQYNRSMTRAFPEGSGGPRFSILRDVEHREAQEFIVGANFSHEISPHWRQDVIGGVFYRTENVDTPGVQAVPGIFALPPGSFDTHYGRYQLLWKSVHKFTETWSAAVGGQLTEENGKRSGNQKLSVFGIPDLKSDFALTRFTPAVFLESEITPQEMFKLTGAVRVDFPQKFNVEASPRIGALYLVSTDINLRANIGRAFKLPSMNSLSDPLIGNKHLIPETSVGGDLGLEKNFQSWQQVLSLTYFYNRFSNLIDLDPDLAARGIFRLVNLSTVEAQGLEASHTFHPAGSLDVKTYFTYLHSDIKNSDQPLRNRPRFSGGVALKADVIENWLVTVNVKGVSRKFDLQIPTSKDSTSPYVKADLAVTFSPNKSWSFYGVVANITNTKYEDYVGFSSPGTNLTFGITHRY